MVKARSLPPAVPGMSAAVSPSRPSLWGGLWLGSIAAIAGLRFSGAVEEPIGFILLAVSMTLLVPFTRAINRRARESGSASLAIIRYNKGMAFASLGYILGLGIAVTIHDREGAEGAAAFALAMLPVLPTMFMIYVMGRYLGEEEDEYLRHRAVVSSLWGLGAVLALGSFWGFLETFEVAPHAPGWFAVPVWAIGMGVAQCWQAMNDGAGEDA